jgi:hypothetical protein
MIRPQRRGRNRWGRSASGGLEQSRLCRLDNAPLKIPFRPLYGFSNGQNSHLFTSVVHHTDGRLVIGGILLALPGNLLCVLQSVVQPAFLFPSMPKSLAVKAETIRAHHVISDGLVANPFRSLRFQKGPEGIKGASTDPRIRTFHEPSTGGNGGQPEQRRGPAVESRLLVCGVASWR